MIIKNLLTNDVESTHYLILTLVSKYVPEIGHKTTSQQYSYVYHSQLAQMGTKYVPPVLLV